jgi:serine/threonine protein kinase
MLPLDGGTANYDNKVDVWALGCILYEMAMDRKAFLHDYATISYCQTRQPLDITLKEGFGPDCQEKIAKNVLAMLEIEPSARPTADGLVHEFNVHLTANSFHNADDVQILHRFSSLSLQSTHDSIQTVH